ncbi:unnamed protein product [Arabidopsis arenosa]|uniref:Transposase Tnp1/En/Spm-like domain-containing protein n=1 Tax=Arabidopsis arenosa TaxID=38785 RepID=A0A8S2AK44_ARAAE|nr:unnamed protein product [Arabidopsis arenosa]
MCIASAKDNSPIVDVVSYYGRVVDIILLDYNVFYIPIFRCQWANIGNGVKEEDGFTLVNLNQSQASFARDPYILASQAQQVFYSRVDDLSSLYVAMRDSKRRYSAEDAEYGTANVGPLHVLVDMDEDDLPLDELNEVDAELEDKENDDEDNEDNVVELVVDDASADNEDHTTNVAENVAELKRKRKRGPTKMKNIAKDPNEKVHVDYTIMGEPCGPGSIPYASYLGTIVWEHVPFTIRDWRKVSEDIKTVLWKSIEARGADNMKDRMSLRPPNITEPEWRKFVKEKTSNAFKVISDSMKTKRKMQIPHCCGREGMVRLREELIQKSSDPSQVTRAKVWIESRTKIDGTPVNIDAAEKIRKAAELEIEGTQDSVTTNPKEDILSQILGPDNPGRLRAMGRGEKGIFIPRQEGDVGENSIHRSVNTRTLPKCNLVDWTSFDDNVVEGRIVSYDADELVHGIPLGPNAVKVFIESATKPEAPLWRPIPEMSTIEDVVGEMIAWDADLCIVPSEGGIAEDIAPKSPSTSSKNRCKLKALGKNDEVVAKGRWQSRELKALVNGLPIGPNAIKVYVDSVLNTKTWLWRPTADMRTLHDSLNCFIVWPANRVVIETTSNESPVLQQSTSKGGSIRSHNEISPVIFKSPNIPVSSTKSASPSYQKDKSPETPKAPLKKTKPSLTGASPRRKSQPSLTDASPRRKSQRLAFKENQKCKLIDISEQKRVVAEGRWSSSDPDQEVHHVKLGPKACRVRVDVVIVNDAAVWRQSPEIEYMQDAHGSCLAWPEDKIVMVGTNEDK